MPDKPEKVSFTKTIDRAIDILECFLDVDRTADGITLTELAEMTGLTASTTYRIASSLEVRHCLHRDPATKKYYLGSLFDKLKNMSNMDNLEILKRVASPYLHDLHQRFNETVGIMIREGNFRTCIDRIDSTNTLRNVINIGERVPVSTGASGKILMCDMSDEEIRALMKDQAEDMFQKLDNIRQDGYSVSVSERQVGVASVSAAIYDTDHKILAALALTGPHERFLNENFQEKIGATKQTAEQITREYAIALSKKN